jgi:hypothetical protein
MKVTVAGGAGSLPIIRLRGLYSAETGAASLHVAYYCGQVRTGKVAYPSLFKLIPGELDEVMHLKTGRGSAIYHINRRYLRFG